MEKSGQEREPANTKRHLCFTRNSALLVCEGEGAEHEKLAQEGMFLVFLRRKVNEHRTDVSFMWCCSPCFRPIVVILFVSSCRVFTSQGGVVAVSFRVAVVP